jgi:hypothetical protein
VTADKLRERGHDVLALDERRDLEGIDDADVLALAAEEQRIVVTFNIRDFAPSCGNRPRNGDRTQAAFWSLASRSNQFGLILDRVSDVLAAWPHQEEWADRAVVVSRAK